MILSSFESKVAIKSQSRKPGCPGSQQGFPDNGGFTQKKRVSPLCGFQNTVTNGLYLVLTARSFQQTGSSHSIESIETVALRRESDPLRKKELVSYDLREEPRSR
jgi:hypothetical protein